MQNWASPLGTQRQNTDEYIFLMGRAPASEFFGFVRTMAVDGHEINQAVLSSEWIVASQHLAKVTTSETGIADNALVLPLPKSMEAIANTALSDPCIANTYASPPFELGLVELDKLVVHQKFINVGFANEVKKTISSPPTEEEIARLAFGVDRPIPEFTIRQAGPGVFQIVSPSNDIRALDVRLLSPDRVKWPSPIGRPVNYVALAVGYGANLLHVLEVEGRLILNNGSHRAYALRDAGVTHVPCVIQRIHNRDHLELVSDGDLMKTPERYLSVPRPALLKDYFDPQLIKSVQVPRKNRMVQVQAVANLADVPA
jgi:hypothetical protein